ncbi:MAG: ankyrin repeat domain-containing protein [Deltaproteobacteria bacterium]|nr:ankyrin repeat domain-containing protein [Deltaproteobacteria bacterium]
MNRISAFLRAIEENDKLTVQKLLQPAIWGLLKPVDVNSRTKEGMTPLTLASRKGFKDIADLLIIKGATKNSGTYYGDTPLILSSNNGHKATAELLISKGADVNAKNNNGDNPILLAAFLGNKEIAELLIEVKYFIENISQLVHTGKEVHNGYTK